MQDFRQVLIQETLAKKLRTEWYRTRVENIHKVISVSDILSKNGVTLQYREFQEEQISCPFHGSDSRPSARVYPRSPTGQAHVWCFVCRERWDAISLWAKFNAGADKSFGQVLSEIERAYGIEVASMPDEIRSLPQENPSLDKFNDLYEATESRLLLAKTSYRKLADITGFLSASSVLDRLKSQVDKGSLTPDKGVAILNQLLERVGNKVRSCPEG